MFPKRHFAPRYFAKRYWSRSGQVEIPWTTFSGRGPGSDGNLTPDTLDYDSFFLTPGEADDLYLQSIPAEFLTLSDADARYLQSVPSDYITQTEADAQGMTPVEASGTGATTSWVREVDSSFTLLAVSSPALYMQTYFNIGSSAITASKPAGYLNTLGSTIIEPNTSALFVKRFGFAQFRRWN